tara:strand:+ start:89 stop:394 length:306 start_codon:yes stop_codon:yes gene_type:complete
MKNLFKFFLILFIFAFFSSCQTVNKKIDESAKKEEEKLSKWLNQSETELKIVFGKPDSIEITGTGNRNYIYISKKLSIKCERKFEINSKDVIVGFSSQNCF